MVNSKLVYKCAACNKDVELGSKYCVACGAQLEWPKTKNGSRCLSCGNRVKPSDCFCAKCGMKISKLKKKGVRRRKSIKLPIDPDKLKRLTGIGLSSVESIFRGLVLVIFLSPLLLTVFEYRKKKIYEWLQNLETESLDMSVFLKHVRSYRRWCVGYAIAIIVDFSLCFISALMPDSLVSILTVISGMPVAALCLVVLGYFIRLAGVILNESESNKMYIYEFAKETELLTTKSSIEDQEEDDDDDDDE